MPINLFNLFDSFWTDPWSSVLGPRSSVLGLRSSVLGPWSMILDLVILDPVILDPWSLILDPWSLILDPVIRWSGDPAILDLVFPGSQVRFPLGLRDEKTSFSISLLSSKLTIFLISIYPAIPAVLILLYHHCYLCQKTGMTVMVKQA